VWSSKVTWIFSDWRENKPSLIEADLVANCGESAEGFYLTALSTVDVAMVILKKDATGICTISKLFKIT
jgi:hypothetical protein